MERRSSAEPVPAHLQSLGLECWYNGGKVGRKVLSCRLVVFFVYFVCDKFGKKQVEELYRFI